MMTEEIPIESGIASIQLKEIPNVDQATSDNGGAINIRKKKIIHFADGSTLEEEEDMDNPDSPSSLEKPIVKSGAHSTDSAPPVDPSKLNWPEWVRHVSSKAGTKTLTVLEGMGETAAYYLGITTPKYQSEIDEYNRMMTKKKAQDEELISWSSGPRPNAQQEPVVDDVKKDQNQEKYVPEK